MNVYTFFDHSRDPGFLEMMATALTAAAFIRASYALFNRDNDGRVLTLKCSNADNSLRLRDQEGVTGTFYLSLEPIFTFTKESALDDLYQICTSEIAKPPLVDWLRDRPVAEGKAIISNMLKSAKQLLNHMAARNLKISDANLVYLTLLRAVCAVPISIDAVLVPDEDSDPHEEVLLHTYTDASKSPEVCFSLQAIFKGPSGAGIFYTHSVLVRTMSGSMQSNSSAVDLLSYISKQGIPLRYSTNTNTNATLQTEEGTDFFSSPTTMPSTESQPQVSSYKVLISETYTQEAIIQASSDTELQLKAIELVKDHPQALGDNCLRTSVTVKRLS